VPINSGLSGPWIGTASCESRTAPSRVSCPSSSCSVRLLTLPLSQAVALIEAVVLVESLGLCVEVQVYPYLPGVGRCIGLAGLIAGGVGVGNFFVISSSARAMRGSGAVDLLRNTDLCS